MKWPSFVEGWITRVLDFSATSAAKAGFHVTIED